MNEGTSRYSLEELKEMETINNVNNFALKYEGEEVKVWFAESDEGLTGCSGYGQEYENQVDVEVYVNGLWTVLHTYEAI